MFKKSTKWFVSILLFFFSFASVHAWEYAIDPVIVGTAGIYTDSRAYSTLALAIAGIGALERDLYIARVETVGTLTIPANVRLHFLNVGAISVTTQLTINTTQIFAGNQAIFAGAGDIDFIAGSVVRSSWFADFDEALDVTNDDTLTLVISEAITMDDDGEVGNNVTLRWESPLILNTDAYDLTNVKNIEAGTYQIFAVGAGSPDFLAGSVVHSSWFTSLQVAVAATGDENVNLTIFVDQAETVAANFATDAYQTLEVKKGCIITVNSGDVLTIGGSYKAGLYQTFIHDNTDGVVFTLGSVLEVYPQWWGAVADGTTDDADAIQAAIDASKGLICKLPPSANEYLIGSPIVIASGNRLIGSSASSNHMTRLKLDSGVDDNVIESDTWTGQAGFIHWFEISNLSIDGNKANNAATSAGIAIYGMAEVAEIHHVHIHDCNDYGISLAGVGAPNRINNVSLDANGVAGVLNAQTGGAVTSFDNISGDDNIVFMRFTGISSNVIINPKIEGEHDPVFDCKFTASAGNNSQVTVIGGYAAATVAETNLVYIDTTGGVAESVTVSLLNFRKNNYTNIFYDADLTQAYANTDQSLEGLYQYNGTIRLYGSAGVFVPFNSSIISEDSLEGTEVNIIKHAAGSVLFDSGAEHFSFRGTGMSGATTMIKHKTTEITCNGATETWTSAIPAGSIVLGITARVTELITGATTIDIGDTDTDLFIDGMAVALNTTANIANSNATFAAPKIYQAQTDITITGIGGAFIGGKLRLVLHYLDLTAPTS